MTAVVTEPIEEVEEEEDDKEQVEAVLQDVLTQEYAPNTTITKSHSKKSSGKWSPLGSGRKIDT